MRVRQIAVLLPVSLLFLPGFAAAQSQGPGPANLDIINIKLGESMNDALQALKADNPKLKVTSSTFQSAVFSKPFTLEVDGQDLPATEGDRVTHATETVQLVFTTPPNEPEVWSMNRRIEFATAQRPALQTTVDALRKKYGPETIPPRDPNFAQTLTWVFDPQGKLITTGGAQMSVTCQNVLGMFLAGIGAGAQAENIAIANAGNVQWPQACTSIIVLEADLQLVQVAPGQNAVQSLTVTLEDGGRYQRELATTKAAVAAFAKAQQDKQTQQMNQVGAPKL